MSLVADAPNVIPRAQLALFVTDPDGTPLEKIIQDLEDQQAFTTEVTPAAVDAAIAAAAAAQSTANIASAKIATATIWTYNDDSTNWPQSRRILDVILPADVTDNTGAFVNVTGMLAALAINTTYLIEAALTMRSAGLGVGVGLTFTLPAGASIVGGYEHQLTTLTIQSVYNTASGAISADPNAVPVINANLPIRGKWVVKTAGTAGNAQLQMRTSAAATLVTLKQDLSVLTVRKIG